MLVTGLNARTSTRHMLNLRSTHVTMQFPRMMTTQQGTLDDYLCVPVTIIMSARCNTLPRSWIHVLYIVTSITSITSILLPACTIHCCRRPASTLPHYEQREFQRRSSGIPFSFQRTGTRPEFQFWTVHWKRLLEPHWNYTHGNARWKPQQAPTCC
jgi:hypothetical protein